MKRKHIGKRTRFAVFHRDGFRCRYCGASGDGTTLHLDHFVAVAKGGTNEIDNLVTACADCNLGKATTAITNWPSEAGAIPCPFVEGWPCEIEDPVYFANDMWAVTDYGLECLTTFYPIEASRLGSVRDGLSDWLLHLTEKEDFALRVEDLIAAFRRALAHHKTELTFDLEASVTMARQESRNTLNWKSS